jgi:6-pyruvoyltetrahydropterin/6-carboxytetrahydropterin synthase
MHGHSFRVEATVRGPADETGWVMDLATLDEALTAAARALDHGLLNEQPGLETPTLERLCLHFATALKPRFAGLSRIVVSRPSIGESCSLAL